ncbi:hypothetical protein QX223_03870, partial [Vibrio vulnificus]|nr:hypothetical protein [Vibrio vulnificus]
MFNIVEVEQGYLFHTFRTLGAAVMDVHDKKTRSRNMKAIRNRDTKPEVKVRKLLHSHGFRYRVAPAAILGKPDIWMAKWNTVIFVMRISVIAIARFGLFRSPDPAVFLSSY